MIEKQSIAQHLPDEGRVLVYLTHGAVSAVLPLKDEQIVADPELMIVLLRRMGYEVRRK
ncbi:hypothetical protein ACSJL2_001960 [Serratia sarumanii]|uniref:hypothetical protein n=1 Tax=Serratia TaxID=613 RepID=UPI0012B54739|nr:hypothetical protein [Serratia marcescens]MBH2790684.1 hypothetical protein [Serratia marcescens]MBI6196306.1 hypothetical protein [Serratia marcescens]WAZ08195.1 hypothetical protein O3T11_17160 [Serratia marcescens]